MRHLMSFYSVSISGYHIAEAGANPITQLAFTLANGFTYVEYYLSRGMDIDEFAPNLSFFFSNGIDPEYAVIGRVARCDQIAVLQLGLGAVVEPLPLQGEPDSCVDDDYFLAPVMTPTVVQPIASGPPVSLNCIVK